MTNTRSSSRRSRSSARSIRLASAALAVAAAIGAGTLQTSGHTLLPAQSQAPAQTTPQFRGRTDVVQVDVAVLDKNGAPVTDLTIADFDVRESGTSQHVDTMVLMTTDPAIAESPASATAPTGATATVVRRSPPRLFVFMLDLTHLSASGFDRTRTALRAFLSDGLRAGDLAGIVVDGRMLGNQIISDKTRLLALFSDVKLPMVSRYAEMRQWPKVIDEEEAYAIAVRRLPEALNAALRRACTERQGECDKAGAEAFVEAQIEAKAGKIAGESHADAQNTIAALKALANGLGRFPGPKHVVLFSEGFYTGEFIDRITDVSGLAAQNNVRISTLDARGLATDARMSNMLGESPLTSTGDHLVLGNDINADVLTTLALETGGERVRNRNNLRPALDRIAGMTGTYYLLGYSPTTPFDGKYRKIEVKVRRPDVTVIARRGYLAARRNGQDAPESAQPEPEASSSPASPASSPPPPSPASERSRVRLEETRAAVTERLSAPGSGGAAAPTMAGALAKEGWALYAEGKVEEARDKLAAASAAGAGVWADYALALTEFTLRRADAAAAIWERVRNAEPNYEPLYFDLADAYLTSGKIGDAVNLLRDASRRWPNDAETHNALGVVLLKRGAIDDAIESFQRAVTAAPGDGTGWFNLGSASHTRYLRRLGGSAPIRALGARDKERALEAYQKYLAIGGAHEAQVKSALAALGWR